MPNLLRFKWRRSKGGYSIREDTPTALQRRQHRERVSRRKKARELNEYFAYKRHWDIESFLNRDFEYSHLNLISNGKEIEEYEPLTYSSGLYKEFVSLKDSPEEYLRFANEYGLLEITFENLQSEHLSVWLRKRNTMREILDLWDECNKNDTLEIFIDEYSGLVGSCSLTLGKSFEKTRVSLYISPNSLFDAMELQFFQIISSNLQVQGCAVCTKWFTFGAGTGRRKSAHYCSDRCRKAAFLERKKSKK